MNLIELREKTLAFLIPIIIIIIVLGWSVALVGKTYFWDVSTLNLQFWEGTKQMVNIEIEARIIYFDADLFGFYYPVHITLPRTYEQECSQYCVFDRLPSGDAVITVFSQEATTRTRVLILPDTVGDLDFRPAFQIIPLTPIETEEYVTVFSDDEKKLLTGTIEEISRTQWLVLLRHNRENIIYDIITQQTHLVPFSSRIAHVARGSELGSYLVWTEGAVMSWDRYGRTATQPLTEFTHNGYIFTWIGDETTIATSQGKEAVDWHWSPLFAGEKMYITNGQGIQEVR